MKTTGRPEPFPRIDRVFSPLPEIKAEDVNADGDTGSTRKTSLFQFPHVWLGALCIFVYVGAEVMAGDAIGTYGQGFGLPLDSTVSASFIYVIVGVHILHVLGGVVALLILFFRAYRTRVRTYSAVPIEVAATYWHFVDGLWIYLLVFFSLAR